MLGWSCTLISFISFTFGFSLLFSNDTSSSILESVLRYSCIAIKIHRCVTFYRISWWCLSDLNCLSKLRPQLAWLQRTLWSASRWGSERQTDNSCVTLLLVSRNRKLLFNNSAYKLSLLISRVIIIFRAQIKKNPALASLLCLLQAADCLHTQWFVWAEPRCYLIIYQILH